MKRQAREVLRVARAYCPGAVVENTAKGHLRVRMMGPQGTQVVHASGSPSDYRASLNLERDIRHAAVKVGTWK